MIEDRYPNFYIQEVIRGSSIFYLDKYLFNLEDNV